MRRTCATCIYWTGYRPEEWEKRVKEWRASSARATQWERSHDIPANTGVCHRSPPHGEHVRQPTTDAQDWCGEHRSTPEAEHFINGGFGEDGPW